MSHKHCKFLSPGLKRELLEKRRASQSKIDYFDSFDTYNQKQATQFQRDIDSLASLEAGARGDRNK